MTNTATPEQLQTIGEQQDLFYQPLQDKLWKDYDHYLFSSSEQLSYVPWLERQLDFINIQIKELQ
jgi:hypothetical protein